jgi:2,4-dienoyl-CoA reductase (NADPH2)
MAADTRYQRLLEPGNIGSVKTRNRIIKTGAGMFMWHEDETRMNPSVLAFYEGIARGGVGLLIVESPTIDYPVGARWRQRYRIDDDRYIEGLSELTEIIHKHGCPTFMQMNHDGPWQTDMLGIQDGPYSGQPIAASNVTFKSENDFHNQEPHVLTAGEIEEKIDKFASAAVRAHKAGFDGVDINSASSHLLHNFLSPFWNRREDEYGGSQENRARFVTSIIKEIKKRLGNDFPVAVCINGVEVGQIAGFRDEDCLTTEESCGIARILQEAGADAIQVRNQWMGYHVGAYLPEALFYPEPPIPLNKFPAAYYKKQKGVGANILFAEAVRKEVSIPVITVGRLDADLGEKVISEGKADFIGMTRRLIADPEYPNKVAAGRLDDIAPCTACDNCLGSRRCRINGLVGTEVNTIEKAPQRKKVIVIGGGPAGMEAARVAALRGHDVTLYEKSSKLGGLLPVAAMVKGNHPEDLPAIVRYLEGQLRKLGVKIRLSEDITTAALEVMRPDVVIQATGGIPTLLKIPGSNRPNVLTSAALHGKLKGYLKYFSPETLRKLSRFYMPVGKKVVIIGSGIQGCELGEFLTKRGRKVTIVDTAEIPGEGMVDALLEHLLIWFGKKGVEIISGVKSMEVTAQGLEVTTAEGYKRLIKADSIIPALPLTPDTGIVRSLEGKISEVYAVGDCNEPLLIADAVGAGSRAARSV